MSLGKNQLFYGDNYEILQKYIKDESIDLVYIDPPFNSKRNYNQIYNNIEELENIGFTNEPFTEAKVSLFDLKSINISSLEEESKEVLDFKKMSIPKLRSIVIERGLSTEASKLKKGDLLKLLEGE